MHNKFRMMISLLNNDINKMHKTTITIIHFIAHQNNKYTYIHWPARCLGLTSLILCFLQYSVFILKIVARILLQCSLWNTNGCVFSRNLSMNIIFKLPIYAVQDLYAKRSGNSLGSSFSYGCNKKSVSFGAFFILASPVLFVFF